MAEASWNGTTDEVKDSTSSGNDGTAAGDATTTTAKIYRGGTFDGNGDYVDIGSILISETNPTFSITVWAYAESIDKYDGLISQYTSGANGRFYIGTINFGDFGYRIGGSSKSGSTISTGSWQHYGFVKNGTAVTGYLNGTSDFTDTAEANIHQTNTLIGVITTESYEWDGIIDEVRISSIARSAAWIKFEYYNINEADNELTWGGEENYGFNGFIRFKGGTIFK